MMDAYTSIVRARRRQNPSLQSLYTFLTETGKIKHRVRMTKLDYFADTRDPERADWTQPTLAQTLDILAGHEEDKEHKRIGQILVIENIDRETMAVLGVHLKIDPLFFASHMHSPWREITSTSPNVSQLPSVRKRRNFKTFPYQQTLVFPEIEAADYKLLQQSNIPRKVVVFPPNRGKRLGVAQRCCSVLFIDTEEKGWLGRCASSLMAPACANIIIRCNLDRSASWKHIFVSSQRWQETDHGAVAFALWGSRRGFADNFRRALRAARQFGFNMRKAHLLLVDTVQGRD